MIIRIGYGYKFKNETIIMRLLYLYDIMLYAKNEKLTRSVI